ncbi:hypothetical protein GEMRC1_002508 [Eukaryota sp. GEM-RC1]
MARYRLEDEDEQAPCSGSEIPRLLAFSAADFSRPKNLLLKSCYQVYRKHPLSDTFSLAKVSYKITDSLRPLPGLFDAGKKCRKYFQNFKLFGHAVYSLLIGRPLVLLSSRPYLDLAFDISNALLIFSYFPPNSSIRFCPGHTQARLYLSSRDLAPISIVPPSSVVLPPSRDVKGQTRDRSQSLSHLIEPSANGPVFISDFASIMYIDRLATSASPTLSQKQPLKPKAKAQPQWTAELPLYRGSQYLVKNTPKHVENKLPCLLDSLRDSSFLFQSDAAFITFVHSELRHFTAKAYTFLTLFKATLIIPPIVSPTKRSQPSSPKSPTGIKGLFRRKSFIKEFRHEGMEGVEVLTPSADEISFHHYANVVDEILSVLNVPVSGSDRNILLNFALRLSLNSSCLRLDKFLHAEFFTSMHR